MHESFSSFLVLGILNKPNFTLFFIPVLFLIYIYRNIEKIKKKKINNFSKIKILSKACLPAIIISIIPILLHLTLKSFLGYENDNILEQFRYIWFEYHVKKGLSTLLYRTFQSLTSFFLFSFFGFIIFIRNIQFRKSPQTERFLILTSWGIFLLPSILIATDIDRIIISFFPVFLFFSLFCIKEQKYDQSPIFWLLLSIRFAGFYFISCLGFNIFPVLTLPAKYLYILETLLFFPLLIQNAIGFVAIYLSSNKLVNRISQNNISKVLNYNSSNVLNRVLKVFNLFKNKLISIGIKLRKPEKEGFRNKIDKE